ncbi:hypothetical protein BDZ97DRAFT_1915110 [Flammula alnicola]|nr:hypothetical protein BDZ97DRAFT_1915110 [Flammula alnicola]
MDGRTSADQPSLGARLANCCWSKTLEARIRLVSSFPSSLFSSSPLLISRALFAIIVGLAARSPSPHEHRGHSPLILTLHYDQHMSSCRECNLSARRSVEKIPAAAPTTISGDPRIRSTTRPRSKPESAIATTRSVHAGQRTSFLSSPPRMHADDPNSRQPPPATAGRGDGGQGGVQGGSAGQDRTPDAVLCTQLSLPLLCSICCRLVNATNSNPCKPSNRRRCACCQRRTEGGEGWNSFGWTWLRTKNDQPAVSLVIAIARPPLAHKPSPNPTICRYGGSGNQPNLASEVLPSV